MPGIESGTRIGAGQDGGQGRGRTADLPLFSCLDDSSVRFHPGVFAGQCIGCNYGVNLTGTELSPCLSASVSGSLPHPLSPALVFSRRPSLSPRGSELFPT